MQPRVIVRYVRNYKLCVFIGCARPFQRGFKPFVLLEIHMMNVVIATHCAVHNNAVKFFSVINYKV